MIHRSKQRLDQQFNVFSVHGVAHFSARIFSQSERAGILTENDLVILGSTGFYNVNPCMQGDSIRSREKEPDRPTTVSDSGLSKALTRPKFDTKWCLTNFRGKLRLFIIISITSARRNLRNEKSCLRTATHQMLQEQSHAPNADQDAGNKRWH